MSEAIRSELYHFIGSGSRVKLRAALLWLKSESLAWPKIGGRPSEPKIPMRYLLLKRRSISRSVSLRSGSLRSVPINTRSYSK